MGAFDEVGREFLAEEVEVDGVLGRSVLGPGLGEAVRKEGGELLDVLGGEVLGVELEFVHL